MSHTLRRFLLLIVLMVFACLVVVLVFFLQENSQWVVIRFPTLQLSWEDPFPIVEYEARLWLVMLAFGLTGRARRPA
jgi:hypothetical protein